MLRGPFIDDDPRTFLNRHNRLRATCIHEIVMNLHSQVLITIGRDASHLSLPA